MNILQITQLEILPTHSSSIKKKFAYKVNEPIHVIMSDFGDFAQGGATAVPNNVVLMGTALLVMLMRLIKLMRE